MKKTKCKDCKPYISAGGHKMVELCDKHLNQKIKKMQAEMKPWHPTNNPISRMLRF